MTIMIMIPIAARAAVESPDEGADCPAGIAVELVIVWFIATGVVEFAALEIAVVICDGACDGAELYIIVRADGSAKIVSVCPV